MLLLLAGSASAVKNLPDGYETICKIDQDDSWKTSLWGSSDSDEYERCVTFLGNRWK